MGKRTVKESPVERGVKETYPHSFTLTGVLPSGTYANATNALYDADGAAVSSWNSGSPSVNSTTFTTSAFVADAMTAGNRYRLYMSMTIDGSVYDWNLWIDARE